MSQDGVAPPETAALGISFTAPAASRSRSVNAFDLGWLMARLRYDFPLRRAYNLDHLPTVNELGADDRVPLGLKQVEGLLDQLGGTQDATKPALAVWTQKSDAAVFRRAIAELHIEILKGLLVADPLLCNAYMAGRTLGDICWQTTDDGLPAAFKLHRIDYVRSWLQSSAAGLPNLSVDAVGDSLLRWHDHVHSPWRQPPSINELRAQGELWRGLLTGELAILPLLTPDCYVDAASDTMKRSARLLRTVIVRMLPLVLLLGLIAAGVISVAIMQLHGVSRAWSVLGTVTGWFGISWSAVRARLARLVAGAEKQIWALSEADAVAVAVTRLPTPHIAMRHHRASDGIAARTSGVGVETSGPAHSHASLAD